METNGIWSEDLKIRAFMVDKNREANLVAIQNMCQEVAGNHANFRKLGYEDMQANGMAWVLNRLKVKVFEFPKWTETVSVKTWVSQMAPFSHRHFQITRLLNDDEKAYLPTVMKDAPLGQILANIYTVWIPIDTTTKRPKRQVPSDLPMRDLAYDCEMPEKLNYTEGGDFSSERQVQYSDLDMLGHVNNAKYVEWLLDDFFKENKIGKPNSLEINYLGEVFQGSTVQLFIQNNEVRIPGNLETEGVLFYSIKNKEDEKEVCRAKLSF